MKFRFPIVIIDEDFRSENTSGLGIRALAQAIESEGFEVLGVTSYGDLSQFAQQQSRASAFILSIDDEEFTPGPDLDPAVLSLRQFIEVRVGRITEQFHRVAQWAQAVHQFALGHLPPFVEQGDAELFRDSAGSHDQSDADLLDQLGIGLISLGLAVGQVQQFDRP